MQASASLGPFRRNHARFRSRHGFHRSLPSLSVSRLDHDILAGIDSQTRSLLEPHKRNLIAVFRPLRHFAFEITASIVEGHCRHGPASGP